MTYLWVNLQATPSMEQAPRLPAKIDQVEGEGGP